MNKAGLTQKEELMLYGLVRFPQATDKEFSEKLNLKHSTVTAIRNRLFDNAYYRPLCIPRLQNMGAQMLVSIYTNFNPLIPLKDRINITGKTIEVFEEIFLSVGERDKGFSMSLSKDYATIGRINDIRTQTFGGRGLLEEEYPTMVVFPFDISKLYRFFDYSPLLQTYFKLPFKENLVIKDLAYRETQNISLNETEKNVFCMIVSYPKMSDNAIGREIGVSRHTVSKCRRKFIKKNLIRWVSLPNLQKLGFEILGFYHMRFDPRNPPNFDTNEAAALMSSSTIFFVSRMYEAVMISVYQDYDDYKKDMGMIIQQLKANHWIAEDPIINTFGLNTLSLIKDFKFSPITHKIVGCDLWIKKLLNM